MNVYMAKFDPGSGLLGLADQATRLGGSPQLSCKRDQIKTSDYMDRRVTPPKQVTSLTWGPLPPCKQALRETSPLSSGVLPLDGNVPLETVYGFCPLYPKQDI